MLFVRTVLSVCTHVDRCCLFFHPAFANNEQSLVAGVCAHNSTFILSSEATKWGRGPMLIDEDGDRSMFLHLYWCGSTVQIR